MALADNWKFSFQLFGGWSFVHSGTFNSVEDFWGGMKHIPKPSQLLTSLEGPREAFLGEENENVRGICLSRSPVVLEWKYPGMNFIFEIETENLPGHDMDAQYEDYCSHIVTEQYPSLLGFRLLDRSKKGTPVKHRWEFWCSEKDEKLKALTDKKNGIVKEINS